MSEHSIEVYTKNGWRIWQTDKDFTETHNFIKRILYSYKFTEPCIQEFELMMHKSFTGITTETLAVERYKGCVLVFTLQSTDKSLRYIVYGMRIDHSGKIDVELKSFSHKNNKYNIDKYLYRCEDIDVIKYI